MIIAISFNNESLDTIDDSIRSKTFEDQQILEGSEFIVL